MRKLDATPEGLAKSLACLWWRPGISAPLPCYYFYKARLGVSPHPPPHSRRPGITPGFSHLDVQGSWRATAPKTPGVPPGLAPRGTLHWGNEDGVARRARGQGAAAEGSPLGLWRSSEVRDASRFGLERGARRGNRFSSFVAQASLMGQGEGTGRSSPFCSPRG